MANLKDIRNRITSVSSTRQITSAMKMVSAAKLRKAQDAITQMRPYANKLKDILESLSASLDANEGVYSEQREENNVLIVGITSNRGLCGGFNNNIIKTIKSMIATDYTNSNVDVLPLGKKINDVFKGSELVIDDEFLLSKNHSIWEDLSYENASSISSNIMQKFADKEYDKVVVVYNKFKNAATQEVQQEQLLPVLPPQNESTETSNTDYIFEPSKEFIVQELIPKSLKVQFYKALLDSHASEHGARMTAMHKATDNASDLIDELKLVYNKARQAAITGEILEIVGGAEALK